MTELIEKTDTAITRFEDAHKDLKAALTPVFKEWLEQWQMQGLTDLDVENILESVTHELTS
jgi:hypothetical protein